MNLQKPKPRLDLHAAISALRSPTFHVRPMPTVLRLPPEATLPSAQRRPIEPPLVRAPVHQPPRHEPPRGDRDGIEVSALIPPAKDYNPEGVWAVLVKVPSDFYRIARVVPSTDQYLQMDPDLTIGGIFTDGVKNVLYATPSPSIRAFDIGKIPLAADPGTKGDRWITIEVKNDNRRELPFFVRLLGNGILGPAETEIVDAQTALDRSHGAVARSFR